MAKSCCVRSQREKCRNRAVFHIALQRKDRPFADAAAIFRRPRITAYEAWESQLRDRGEKDALISKQLEERQALEKSILQVRAERSAELSELNAEIASDLAMDGKRFSARSAFKGISRESHSRPIKKVDRTRTDPSNDLER